MTLHEALKSGKRIKRTWQTVWQTPPINDQRTYWSTEEILANDWEVEEKVEEVTKTVKNWSIVRRDVHTGICYYSNDLHVSGDIDLGDAELSKKIVNSKIKDVIVTIKYIEKE